MIGILAIPVDPDAPGAKELLREELSKPQYTAAKPTWFDQLSKGFFDWLASLTAPGGEGFGAWIPVILTVLFVGILVAAFLIFGMPRLGRRSRMAIDLFGEDDRRSAAELRRAAHAEAATGNWTLACADMFRALSRGLLERTIVMVSPGTTAHDFAVAAAVTFPAESRALLSAAAVFDDVRYLGRDGTEHEFRSLSALDERLRSAQPTFAAGPGQMESVEPADPVDPVEPADRTEARS